MDLWMKNLGYPEFILLTTQSWPSSYPTVASHVGKVTETACGVLFGMVAPISCEIGADGIAGGTDVCVSNIISASFQYSSNDLSDFESDILNPFHFWFTLQKKNNRVKKKK